MMTHSWVYENEYQNGRLERNYYWTWVVAPEKKFKMNEKNAGTQTNGNGTEAFIFQWNAVAI